MKSGRLDVLACFLTCCSMVILISEDQWVVHKDPPLAAVWHHVGYCSKQHDIPDYLNQKNG